VSFCHTCVGPRKPSLRSIASIPLADRVEEIDGQLSQAERARGSDKPHHLARAQLLFQELSSRSMLRCTRAITLQTWLVHELPGLEEVGEFSFVLGHGLSAVGIAGTRGHPAIEVRSWTDFA
jgi:hypothetical protein